MLGRAAYFRDRNSNLKLDTDKEISYVRVLECCYRSVESLETLQNLYEKRKLHESTFFITACKEYTTDKKLNLDDFLFEITSRNIGLGRREQQRRTAIKSRLLKKARNNLVLEKKILLCRYLCPYFELYDKYGNIVQPRRKIK